MTETFNTFIGKIETSIINPAITLLGLGAFVIFVWGLVQFILALQGGSVISGSESKQNPGIGAGKQHMIWGFVGFVIIFGAKAIIALLAATVGVSVPAS